MVDIENFQQNDVIVLISKKYLFNKSPLLLKDLFRIKIYAENIHDDFIFIGNARKFFNEIGYVILEEIKTPIILKDEPLTTIAKSRLINNLSEEYPEISIILMDAGKNSILLKLKEAV